MIVGRSLDAIFDESVDRAEKELTTIPLEAIHELGISKTHNDLLGSHTVVTYPPLDALVRIGGDRLFDALQFQPQVDTYLHIPYCEYPCKFCPYTTLNVGGKDSEGMGSYFEALKTEIKNWAVKLRSQESKVRSMYIGGGTPFALSTDSLEDLLSFVRNTLPFTDSSEICVETSPKATIAGDTQEKLVILKKYGITRISIGIQSFDFETLRDTARTFRGHTTTDEARAVRILLESGIPNINVDMIQDLPILSKTNLDRLKQDLIKIAELRPQHVTWYNLRLRPETSYVRISPRLPNEQDSLLTRLTIWNFMESAGYLVQEGDRFVLGEKYEDRFRKTRGSVETDLLGIGVSAYSHVYPAFFQNSRVIGGNVRSDSRVAVKNYVEAVRRNGNAITSGYKMTEDEILAGKFALGLKRGVDLRELHDTLSISPETHAYNNLILNRETKLIDVGLLGVSPEGILGFTRTGRLFENEICARFYTPRAIYLGHMNRGTVTDEIDRNLSDYEGVIAVNQAINEPSNHPIIDRLPYVENVV